MAIVQDGRYRLPFAVRTVVAQGSWGTTSFDETTNRLLLVYCDYQNLLVANIHIMLLKLSTKMTRQACTFIFQWALVVLLLVRQSVSFQYAAKQPTLSTSSSSLSSDSSKVTMPSAELDDMMGLTSNERTVVNVHRVASQSVVYVTSVLKTSDANRRQLKRRRGISRARQPKDDGDQAKEGGMQKLPQGTLLGSGSGFVVDADGYIVTNYHVIQRAYETNQMVINYEQFLDNLGKNSTRCINGLKVEGLVDRTVDAIFGRDDTSNSDSISSLPACVFVRFGTNGNGQDSNAWYYACEIVDVVKELDIAVLRMQSPMNGSERMPLKALSYGSSSNLLVGQTLLAIGNPFGLDRTITSGLVSALGRTVTGVAGNPINNCIQTDASINPGKTFSVLSSHNFHANQLNFSPSLSR